MASLGWPLSDFFNLGSVFQVDSPLGGSIGGHELSLSEASSTPGITVISGWITRTAPETHRQEALVQIQSITFIGHLFSLYLRAASKQDHGGYNNMSTHLLDQADCTNKTNKTY